MKKSTEKVLVISLLICVILLPNVLIVKGEQPTIASRIANISDIALIQDSELIQPNTSLFRMNLTVEILNKEDENQTVTETSDFSPKVFINGTLENSTFVLEQIIYVHSTIMTYTYKSGITTEYESIYFYINQTDLTQLPDGNYTLWRPINTAYQWLNTAEAEVLLTIIQMSSSGLNITYCEFDYYPTETTGTPVITISVVSALLALMTVNKRRKCTN